MREQLREENTVAVWQLDRFAREAIELLLDGLHSAA
jgi:DNA invertase Pin-like site-specific DNA recombinase